MSRLDRLGILMLELPQPKRLPHSKSLNTAFLSTGGIKYDINNIQRKELVFILSIAVVTSM